MALPFEDFPDTPIINSVSYMNNTFTTVQLQLKYPLSVHLAIDIPKTTKKTKYNKLKQNNKFTTWETSCQRHFQLMFSPFPIRHVPLQQFVKGRVMPGVFQVAEFMGDDIQCTPWVRGSAPRSGSGFLS